MIHRTTKGAITLMVASALAMSAAITPSDARDGRVAAGIAGFALGAAAGAAAGRHYGPGYYAYAPGYYGYGYAPGYYGAYASEPGYVYGPNHYATQYQLSCVIPGAYRPDFSYC